MKEDTCWDGRSIFSKENNYYIHFQMYLQFKVELHVVTSQKLRPICIGKWHISSISKPRPRNHIQFIVTFQANWWLEYSSMLNFKSYVNSKTLGYHKITTYKFLRNTKTHYNGSKNTCWHVFLPHCFLNSS